MCFVASLHFFLLNCQCHFTDATFAHNLQVSKFIVWTSFTLLFARVCFCLGCLYDFCGPWLMCCAFIARFPFSTRQNEFNTIRAVFVVREHACKTCPEHRLLSRFPLFSCPPVQIPPTAPMWTHVYPSGAVRAPFAFFFAKHDVRGNFPGHTALIRACTTIFVPACIVSVPPHAPCTPTHPY